MGHFSKSAIIYTLMTVLLMANSKLGLALENDTGVIYSIELGEKNLWLGGEFGLFSLVGTKKEHYDEVQHKPFENDIEDLYEDDSGNLWIATFGKGVYKFNGDFFRLIDITSEMYCRNIVGDSDKIFIGCEDKVFIFDVLNKSIAQIEFNDEIPFNDVTHLFIDNSRLYIVENNHSVIMYDIQSGLMNLVLKEKFAIRDIFVERGNLYLATSNGLKNYDMSSDLMLGTLLSDKRNVAKILNVDSSFLIFYQNGFKKLDKRTSVISDFYTDMSIGEYQELFDIAWLTDDSFIYSAPIDGISSFTPIKASIKILSKEDIQSKYIADTLSLDSNVVVFGDKYLSVLSSNLDSLVQSIPLNGFVKAATSNGKNLIFFTANGIDITMFNISSNNPKNLPKITDSNIDSGEISELIFIENKGLFASSLGGENPGLFLFTGKEEVSRIMSGNIDTLIRTKNGDIFVATRFDGIFKLPDLDEVENITQPINLIHNCLVEDLEARLWVCTDGKGLGLVNFESGEIDFIDPSLTGDSRHIRELVVDTEGYLWLMTNKGLIRYHHDSESSIKLGEEDGILDTDFEITASINLNDDKILVAGDRKNYIIDTRLANEHLNVRQKLTSKTFLTDINTLSEGEQGFRSRINQSNSTHAQSSTLTLNDSNILLNLSFGANDFLNRDVFRYEYRLLGLDNSWVKTPPQVLSASYSTLPPGNYEFQVRVVDHKSTMPQPTTSLKIVKLPPFWQTWKMYVLLSTAIGLALLFYLRYRTYRLGKLNEELEESVRIRTDDLADSQAEIEELLEQKEMLFANISHDLRTPLTLIIGPLEVLEKSLESVYLLRQTELIKESSLRINLLVDQIMDLTRLNYDDIYIKNLYDVSPSIESITDAFQDLIALKRQDVVTNFNATGFIECRADTLEKLSSNLLSNAYKYAPEHSQIVINSKHEGGYWILEILNTIDVNSGIYVDENIFLSPISSNQHLSNSSGLGLFLIKRLIESDGGSIEVVTLDNVVKFTVTFPFVERTLTSENVSNIDVSFETQIQSELKRSRALSINTIEDNPNASTILIVEDDSTMRDYLKSVLSRNFNVLVGKTGEEGYKQAEEHNPDLILSDLIMPGDSGFAFVDNVRQNDDISHIPFVLLTGLDDDITRLQSWEHHIDDVITKPFSQLELVSKIDSILHIRKSLASKMGLKLTNSKNTILALDRNKYYTERDKKFFSDFTHWLENNFANEMIQRKDAADAMAVSERQLNRKLNALANTSFNEVLRKYRLVHAKKRLEEGGQITQVSYECGISSGTYFSTCFKDEYGMSPKAYIESLKQSL